MWPVNMLIKLHEKVLLIATYVILRLWLNSIQAIHILLKIEFDFNWKCYYLPQFNDNFSEMDICIRYLSNLLLNIIWRVWVGKI